MFTGVDFIGFIAALPITEEVHGADVAFGYASRRIVYVYFQFDSLVDTLRDEHVLEQHSALLIRPHAQIEQVLHEGGGGVASFERLGYEKDLV